MEEKEALQRVFNAVWKGLESQGWQRSLDSHGDMCAYRGAEGRRCAVGWLIPDDSYHGCLEGDGVDVSSVRRALLPGLQALGLYTEEKVCVPTGKVLDLLGDLQVVHDNSCQTVDQLALRDVAERYGITTPQQETAK